MSGISIMSSLPRTIIRGFKDSSLTVLPTPVEDLPQYLPWYMLMTQWGPTDDATFTDDGAFLSTYGAKSLDPLEPYFTHATECARRTMAKGNVAMITRITAPDADIARFRLAIEYVEDDLPEYERNDDGTYRRNARGELITTGQTIPGIKARWLMLPIGHINGEYQFGRGRDIAGTMVSSTGQVASIRPFMDIEMRFKGKRGNNIGVRIASPTMTSADPIDGDLVDEMGACIHRMWVVERESRFSNAQIYPGLQGEMYVDFTTKPNTINTQVRLPYYSDEVLLDAYESRDPNDRLTYGLLGRIHTYEKTIEDLQELIYVEESGYDVVNKLAETPHRTINMLTGVHYNDVPYYTFQVLGPLDGGLQFSENTTHYGINGSDGDTDKSTYDSLVAEHLANFENGEIPYMDSARYPFSAWVDTGYSLDTKKAAINIMKRRDTFLDISTQDVMRPLNSATEDSSIAVSLRAWFRSLPESTYYGTAAVRASIWAHAGEMHSTDYRGILPFTIAIAELTADYMGAGDGIMVAGLEFDSARTGRSLITQFRTHNVVYRSETARNKDWNNGLNFAQAFDRRSIHWPGQQTIYDKSNSVLRTRINALIGCNLTRIGETAWRVHTGEAKLDDLQLITAVDQFIVNRAKGRYDGRVIVQPESRYTEFDKLLGDRYTTVIKVGATIAKLVEDLTIDFYRKEDLQEGGN